ncbi:MAG: LamG-like jellyroll fold domain-containing protein [Ignavibacteria bacterium]
MMKNIFLLLTALFFFNTGFAQYTANYSGNFNGSNSYIAVPNATDLNPVGAVTLEAMVYPTGLNAATMTVIGKNYQTSYFLGIQTSGRVVFYPRGGSSFRSKVSSVIPVNKWTHIAGTFDGTTARIYIDGVLDTSSTAFAGTIGVNSDSLFIGADRIGTSAAALFFKGRLENIRIWNNSRFDQSIFNNRFLPLEVYFPTGFYSNLVASFQLDSDVNSYSGVDFHNGYARNFTFINNSNKAVNNIDYNNNLVLNGSTDYFSVFNTSGSGFNPTTAITLEAWIRRDTTGTQPNDQYIVNKSGGTDRYNYALWLFSGNGSIKFKINSPGGPSGMIANVNITHGQWTHVAASYNSATGFAYIYINGNLVASSIFTGAPLIQNNPDDLFIGGIGASSLSGNKFKGQIDAVRIWSLERTPDQITSNMYKSISSDIGLTYFNFDKYTSAIYSGGSRIYSGNTFGGLAHVSSSHLNYNNELTSPMISDVAGGFYTPNYTNSYKRFFVPDNNLAGIKDSVFIPVSGTISSLKVFALMSHTYTSDMSLHLISPSGSTVNLFNNRGGNGNDLMTIFSDAEDSLPSMGTFTNEPGINPPFSPGIKPNQPLSAFNSQNKLGWWKLKFVDNASADIGYIHGWGINIAGTSDRTLHLKAFIQGFYRFSLHKMIKDTAKIFLRNSTSPYIIVDTAKSILDSAGNGTFVFDNASNGTPYYIAAMHRNSIETWSAFPQSFNLNVLNYDFSFSASQAFGNNMIYVDALAPPPPPEEDETNEKNDYQTDGSTERYAFYSGDTNQDGIVDATDLAMIDNDAYNFSKGYLKSDLTGDNVVDASDAAIADNNAANFVSKITP